MAGGFQERVSLPQRDIEDVGQEEHHFAARPRASGLDEAHVPGGDVASHSQVELAHPSGRAPPPEEGAKRPGLHLLHYLTRNCGRPLPWGRPSTWDRISITSRWTDRRRRSSSSMA